MKFINILLLSVLLSGHAYASDLQPLSKVKPGVASEGSLANVQLINDAKLGISKFDKTIVLDKVHKFSMFVIQQPKGSPGSREWREAWMVSIGEETKSYIVTFKEDGLNAANFEIKNM